MLFHTLYATFQSGATNNQISTVSPKDLLKSMTRIFSASIFALLLCACTRDDIAEWEAMRAQHNANTAYTAPAASFGQPVYSAGECVGPIIMGECHGAIIPQSAYHQTCYGEMLNGACTGPMF